MKSFIIGFMKGYLQQHGYLVEENHLPMLLVSGNAIIHFDKDRLFWEIAFPIKPYLVVLNGSYASYGES